jgi:seryl-tRNA synthetase
LPLADAAVQQRDRLIESGHLVPTGARGLYGLAAPFQKIVSGIESVVERAGADRPSSVVRFPPVVPTGVFEKSGYLQSFPNLAAVLFSFGGGDAEHADLVRRFDSGADWTGDLAPIGSVLCSAACHPLYATIAGPLTQGGGTWAVYGWVFRHEPSDDPARMQSFRQYEYVRVGEPDEAVEHRDYWRERATTVLSDLGLDVRTEVANDPFFGRAGRMLAANQQNRQLKYEVLAYTQDSESPTAIASANYHEDHFGSAFDIRTVDGAVAHSACVGFGVERIALALLWQHGLDSDQWPPAVRRQLWP